jgi:hypothetical protein
VRRFLASLPTGQVDVALEATTGWRFIVEELLAASSLTRCALSRPRVMSVPPEGDIGAHDRGCSLVQRRDRRVRGQ